jgi:hypothetical protein
MPAKTNLGTVPEGVTELRIVLDGHRIDDATNLEIKKCLALHNNDLIIIHSPLRKEAAFLLKVTKKLF